MPPLTDEARRKFEEDQRRLHANPEIRKALPQNLEIYSLTRRVAPTIPVLDGWTPLQCMKTPEGRLQLEALINRMEIMDQARPDYLPGFDMNLLRGKLGLPIRNKA